MKEIFVRNLEYFNDPQAIEPGLILVDYLGGCLERGDPFYVAELANIVERRLDGMLPRITDVEERTKALGLTYFAMAAALKLPGLLNRCQTEPFVGNFPEELGPTMREQSGHFGGSKMKGGLWELWYLALDEVCRGFDEEIERGSSTQVAIWGDWVIPEAEKVLKFERAFLAQFRVPSLPQEDLAGRAARATRWIDLCSLRGQALFVLSSGLKDGLIKIGK